MEVTHPAVQTAADEAERFTGRLFRNGRGYRCLVLYGPPGCGKTHILNALSRWARAAHISAAEVPNCWKQPFSEMRASWPKIADVVRDGRTSGVLEDMIESDFLALDDIGAEYDPWKLVADKLCQLLSRRENKFSIITSNIAPGAWAEKWDSRIEDRLLRNSFVCDMSMVPSYAEVVRGRD